MLTFSQVLKIDHHFFQGFSSMGLGLLGKILTGSNGNSMKYRGVMLYGSYQSNDNRDGTY
jgi:L-lactate permease